VVVFGQLGYLPVDGAISFGFSLIALLGYVILFVSITGRMIAVSLRRRARKRRQETILQNLDTLNETDLAML